MKDPLDLKRFNLWKQLLGVRRGGDAERAARAAEPFADAVLCLARRDYAGFWNALPPEARAGLRAFLHGEQ